MKWQTYFKLALTETRNARGKLAFSLFSIALGVASVTAVRTTIFGFEASIASQARDLMGADLAITSTQPFSKAGAQTLFQELDASGSRSTSLTRFYSMLYKKEKGAGQGQSSLVSVRAVEGDYPFYGEVATQPPGKWSVLLQARQAAVILDEDLLARLKLKVGDQVFLGQTVFTVIASIVKQSGSPVNSFALASGIYLHRRYLESTGLVQTGSRIFYSRLYQVPPDFDVVAWKAENFARAAQSHITIRTYHEAAANLQRFLSRFSNFLTIISLIILLLGGVGAGSALSVFMKTKQDHVAIFRNLGLQPHQVFGIYFILAIGLGSVGSLLGAIPGSLLPLLLSHSTVFQLMAEFLPFDLNIVFSGRALFYGLASGMSATLLFVLLPVYRLRRISPLRILRKDAGWKDLPSQPKELAIFGLIFGLAFLVCLGLAADQLHSLQIAFYFAAFLALSLGILFLFSWGVTRLIHHTLPYVSSYHIRQGIANLYRPNNQTTMVISSLGAGFLLLGSVFVIEASFRQELAIEDDQNTPNHFVIDVQPDQYDEVLNILQRGQARSVYLSPMVSARILRINGKEEEYKNIEQNSIRQNWSDRLRSREHYIGYRRDLLNSETIVAGRFWQGRSEEQELSVDENWAEQMDVDIGDTITFDIQGISLQARISNFRRVRWQSMQPNTMLLLSPGMIEQAPYIYIGSYRISDKSQSRIVQNRLVERYPNLRVVNLTEVTGTVSAIMGQIALVMRFLALLTLLNGGIILTGTIFSSRFARLREAMLLKVLGANRRDLYFILITEYGVLACLACLCGWLLTEGVNRFLLTSFFRVTPLVPYEYLLGILLSILFLTLGIGFLVSREVARTSPLETLRAE